MSGWLTNGVGRQAIFTGLEVSPLDTNLPSGQQPLSDAANLVTLATAYMLFTNFASKTTVSGSRYYSSVTLGNSSYGSGNFLLATGIQVLIGSTGGTDNWLVELHDSTGALVATSALAGALVGTAGTWQQFAFLTPTNLASGTYFLAVQSNGTTAHPAVYNFPAPALGGPGLLTGSATGSFGTSASITPPTTYTAALGPVALLY